MAPADPPTRRRRPRCPRILLGLVGLALGSAGCVALTGQRITFLHDAAHDTFHVLLQYDGIHEDRGDRRGRRQIPAFLADGDVMLLDWYMHVRRANYPKGRRVRDPVTAAAARVVQRLKVRALGTYREPPGRDGFARIGAAQLVTIEEFSTFLPLLDELIRAHIVSAEGLVSSKQAEDVPWRTLARMVAAARTGHRWVTARGHALQLHLPVHPDEWAEVKGDVILRLAEAFARYAPHAANDAHKELAERIVRSIGSCPFSYVESGDEVTFTLGSEARPQTIHLHLRDDYNEDLAGTLRENVPVDLDRLLRTPDDPKWSEPPMRVAREMLAPEAEVGAWLGEAESPDTARMRRAWARLEVIGTAWNAAGGHSTAPARIRRWTEWYRRRRRLAALPALF